MKNAFTSLKSKLVRQVEVKQVAGSASVQRHLNPKNLKYLRKVLALQLDGLHRDTSRDGQGRAIVGFGKVSHRKTI